MNKRWMQSILIFTVIIVFLVVGYLFLKKYNPTETPAFNNTVYNLEDNDCTNDDKQIDCH